MSVVPLRRGKAAPKPTPAAPRYHTVTPEQCSAADDLLRAAQTIHRLTTASFVTPEAVKRAQASVSAAHDALARLGDQP